MADVLQKLNTMEKKQGGDDNNKQIINVTYGHYGSGKLYSYYGANKRAGDIVTPEVTKGGKTYKTLAVVRSTHKLPKGQDTVDHLQSKGIGLKTLPKTDQKSLPGYYQGWEKDAQAADELKKETLIRNDISKMEKLSLLGEIRKLRKKEYKMK